MSGLSRHSGMLKWKNIYKHDELCFIDKQRELIYDRNVSSVTMVQKKKEKKT